MEPLAGEIVVDTINEHRALSRSMIAATVACGFQTMIVIFFDGCLKPGG